MLAHDYSWEFKNFILSNWFYLWSFKFYILYKHTCLKSFFLLTSSCLYSEILVFWSNWKAMEKWTLLYRNFAHFFPEAFSLRLLKEVVTCADSYFWSTLGWSSNTSFFSNKTLADDIARPAGDIKIQLYTPASCSRESCT